MSAASGTKGNRRTNLARRVRVRVPRVPRCPFQARAMRSMRSMGVEDSSVAPPLLTRMKDFSAMGLLAAAILAGSLLGGAEGW